MNKSAFLDLLREHQGILQKICIVFSDKAEKEDLYQEILLQLWRSRKRFERKRGVKFSTWMYRVAFNTAVNMRRKHHGEHGRESDLPNVEFPDVRNQPEAIESIILLKRVFQGLTFPERALLFMHLEKCSYLEIGEYLGISEGNVGVRLHRIKQKIKTLLEAKHGH